MSVIASSLKVKETYHSHAFPKHHHHILIRNDSRRGQEEVRSGDMEERDRTYEREC